jgi:glycerophosphoryl diester phosphodiesterase
MKLSHYFVAGLLLISFSCSLNHITPPPSNSDTNLINTIPVSNATMKNMEAIYSLSDGNVNLGTEFVCKISKYKISFFSNESGIFIILKYGLNPSDSSLQFSGFWRFSETSTQGNISFSVAKNEGASDLLKTGSVANLILKGSFKDGDGILQSLSIKYSKSFSPYAKSNPFIVLAHHGVQTTAGPPYSENSVGGVLHDEEYGCTGIEFDVRLTKDNVPICLHDNAINVRLTKKGPLAGEPNQYPFALLEKYIRLVDGEKIPSVEQVLNAFIDSTSMKYIWFDIKGDPDIFKYMEPVMRAGYARAQAQGRDVVFFTGLPSDDVIAEFHKQPTYATLPMLCELEVQDVIDNNCQFWGPRYSRGLLLDGVDQLHQRGVKVISWTLNDKGIIKDYLKNGKFDGFISDYTAYVVYDFYTMF